MAQPTRDIELDELSTAQGSAAPGQGPGASSSTERLAAALPAQSRRREIWTGVFVLAGILAVLTALFTLTSPATFRGRYIVSTVVTDAGGIRRGDPVQMRGVNIGRVQKFRMVPDGVQVELELEGEYEVPRDSRVVLRSAGIMGGVIADIVPGLSEERLRGRETLPGEREGGVFDLADGLGEKAADILDRIEETITVETLDALGGGVYELRDLLAELSLLAAEQRTELAELTSSLSRSAAGVERVTTGPELEEIIERLSAITGRTEEVTTSLGRASASLEEVLARVERGEGTLGMLSTDPSLYENLARVTATLDELLTDLKENPSRYLNVRIF